jgi:hypothetical protein
MKILSHDLLHMITNVTQVRYFMSMLASTQRVYSFCIILQNCYTRGDSIGTCPPGLVSTLKSSMGKLKAQTSNCKALVIIFLKHKGPQLTDSEESTKGVMTPAGCELQQVVYI